LSNEEEEKYFTNMKDLGEFIDAVKGTHSKQIWI